MNLNGYSVGQNFVYGGDVPIHTPDKKIGLEAVLDDLDKCEDKVTKGENNGTKYTFVYSKIVDSKTNEEERFLMLTLSREDAKTLEAFKKRFGEQIAGYINDNNEVVYEWDWTKSAEGRINVLNESYMNDRGVRGLVTKYSPLEGRGVSKTERNNSADKDVKLF
jgi:hypothetical protein